VIAVPEARDVNWNPVKRKSWTEPSNST